jgi:hypothetical protein
MVGVAIYHCLDLREHADRVPLLIKGVEEITGCPCLVFMSGTLSESGRTSREVRLSPKSLDDLVRDLRDGRYESVEFNQAKRSDRERNVEGASLDLRISADPQAGDGAPCPHVVYVLIPNDASRDANTLALGADTLARALDSPYAFIYGGASFSDVYMELTATPIFPWDHVFTPEEKRRRDRLLQHQLERVHIGVKARGAYWGNFLGPHMVAELGGLERLLGEAPVASVRAYGAGGAYLQMSDHPLDWHRPEHARSRSELTRFLAKISIADVPE